MRRAASFAIATIAFATGCRTLPFPDPHLEGEYGKALKKWTRTVAVYSGLETRAFVRMVYLSPEFVNAQALHLSQMRAELPDQSAQTLEKMREEYRQPSFFAVTYMPDRTANDWNEPQSVWRIALNQGGGEAPPDRVQRFERPFSAELRALYPYIDDYSTAYLLRFPERSTVPPFGELQMVIAGALGKMQFFWRLDGNKETPSTAEGGPEEKPQEPKKR